MIKLQTEITSEIFKLLNELDIFGKLQHVAAWLDKKYSKYINLSKQGLAEWIIWEEDQIFPTV